MNHAPDDPDNPACRPSGFTLMELLVVCTLISLVFAIIVPNLGAFIPEARLEGSGKRILRELDMVRSEARIQGKRLSMEFDLQHAQWRVVLPPEQKLTRDQDVWTLDERPERWVELEKDVVFVGAGDAKAGLAKHGLYRLTFDEYGFTGDQLVVLKLASDPTMVWSMSIHGLTGRITVEKSEKGEIVELAPVNEGAF